MGFFSWKTSDTNKAIRNIYAGGCKTVYLLQPNGKPPIKETAYEGHGEFGGVDAFDWLADNNIEKSILDKAEKLNIEKRLLGIYINSDYYIDTRDGKKFSYMLSELFEDLNPFPGNYGSKYKGTEINALIKDGIWKKSSFEDYFGKVKHPLKFSFSKDASYEELPASQIDENQGYF